MTFRLWWCFIKSMQLLNRLELNMIWGSSLIHCHCYCQWNFSTITPLKSLLWHIFVTQRFFVIKFVLCSFFWCKFQFLKNQPTIKFPQWQFFQVPCNFEQLRQLHDILSGKRLTTISIYYFFEWTWWKLHLSQSVLKWVSEWVTKVGKESCKLHFRC